MFGAAAAIGCHQATASFEECGSRRSVPHAPIALVGGSSRGDDGGASTRLANGFFTVRGSRLETDHEINTSSTSRYEGEVFGAGVLRALETAIPILDALATGLALVPLAIAGA